MPNQTNRNASGERLSFVKAFMAEHNISQKDVSSMLGKSKCAVSHMFSVADDMRLSEIEKIFGLYDCHLRLLITRDPDEPVDKYSLGSFDKLAVDGELVDPRLYFILVAMKRYGVNREQLSYRLGVKSSTVRYWIYVANDVYISKIIEVAAVLKCHLKIKIIDETLDRETQNLPKNPEQDECRMIIETNSVRTVKF